MEDQYKVVLTGLRSNIEPSAAKTNLASLFKTSPEQIDRVLAQANYVIKRGLALDIASKYQRAIEGAGGICVTELESVPPSDLDFGLSTTSSPIQPQPRTKPSVPSSDLAAQQSAIARASTSQGIPKLFCQKCGAQLPKGAAFCGGCGDHVAAAATNPAQKPPSRSGALEGEAVMTFVGKNYEYFKTKWELAEQKENKSSWNWSAFFGGFAWMAYRKMYMYSWIFIGILAIEALCEFAFGLPDKLANAINLSIAVTFGLQGNYLYRMHVDRKVKEILAMNPPERVNIELARQGGTSMGAAVGFVVALVAVAVLIVLAAEG